MHMIPWIAEEIIEKLIRIQTMLIHFTCTKQKPLTGSSNEMLARYDRSAQEITQYQQQCNRWKKSRLNKQYTQLVDQMCINLDIMQQTIKSIQTILSPDGSPLPAVSDPSDDYRDSTADIENSDDDYSPEQLKFLINQFVLPLSGQPPMNQVIKLFSRLADLLEEHWWITGPAEEGAVTHALVSDIQTRDYILFTTTIAKVVSNWFSVGHYWLHRFSHTHYKLCFV